jgi:hypothetical protein
MEAANVRAVRYTGTGACGVGRARLVGLVITTAAGTPRLTITEGSGGTTRLDVDFFASGTHTFDVPGDGILFATDPHISTATNVTGVTLFFV